MTAYTLPDEAARYFELRDIVAEHLKMAGVKKHSRHAVAEVLIDSGVLDIPALLAGQTGETDAEDFATIPLEDLVGHRVNWAGRHGQVTDTHLVDGQPPMVTFSRSGAPDRVIPAEWVELDDEPES